MWFALIMFWYSLTIVHHIVLYVIVFSLAFYSCICGRITGNLYSKWNSHHLYNQIDCIITWSVSVWNSIPDSRLLSDRVKVLSIFIILIAIMISSTMFMKLGYSQKLICSQVIIQKTTFETRLSYYDFLIVFSELPTPGDPYWLGRP